MCWKKITVRPACNIRADSEGTEAAEEPLPLIAIHYVKCKRYFTDETQNAIVWNRVEVLNSCYEWKVAAYIID